MVEVSDSNQASTGFLPLTPFSTCLVQCHWLAGHWWSLMRFPVPLPSGGILTPRGLQLLGLKGLGSSTGFERLHYLYVRRGQPDAGFALFESESLKWPGFVEFVVNSKVLTFSTQDCIYKVFDLNNYSMLYSISDKKMVYILHLSMLQFAS